MDNDFKGVWIPREIWLLKGLSIQEKAFLSEITSLDNQEGCYASNDYFSQFFGLSKRQVSRTISDLKEKGYIDVKLIYKDGTKQIEKRIINVTNIVGSDITPIDKSVYRYSQKCREVNDENDHSPIDRNGAENNTSINNTININNIYTQLFNYWNEKGIIKHREMNQKMKSHTNARLEKYSVDELIQAIDNYKQVLDSSNHYWTHKWTYEQFMKPNNVTRFVDEADPLNNFRDSKFKNKKTTSIEYDPNKDAF